MLHHGSIHDTGRAGEGGRGKNTVNSVGGVNSRVLQVSRWYFLDSCTQCRRGLGKANL